MNNKNAISVTVDLKMNGIDKKLEEIDSKIARRLMRKALKAVGTQWVEAVKAKAPTLIGDLRESIGMRIRTRKSKGGGKGFMGSVEVGPDMKYRRTDDKKSVGPGIFAMWVEFGLRRKKYKAEPFMRPVFDATADRVEHEFAEILREGLARALKD